MVETAAHLVDQVFPALPVRQGVLSLPKRLRYHLGDAELQARLTPEAQAQLQVTLANRVVSLFIRRGLLDKADGEALRPCEHGGGFTLDASVRSEGEDRQGRERQRF